MSGLIQPSNNCHHTWHVFHAPLCERLPLWKKVANIMFHFLTLGIPFLLYRLIACCFKKESASKTGVIPLAYQKLSKEELAAIRSGRKPYPHVSLLADSVIQKIQSDLLENRPDVSPSTIFSEFPKEKGYLNVLTTRLSSLREECEKNLKQVLKEHGEEEDYLSHPDIIKSVDQYIEVAFVEGMSMLGDLRAYRTVLISRKRDSGGDSDDREIPSHAQLLCSKVYPYFHIVTVLPLIYLKLRSGLFYNQKHDRLDIFDDKELPECYNSRFETKGTSEFNWRQLFNEYCQFVHCLTDADSEFKDFNRSSWITKFLFDE